MAERATQEPGGPTAQGPRPLPWNHRGRAPLLPEHRRQGYLANLADNIEAIQLGMGEDLLEYARDAMAPDAKTLSATEYRWLARRLTEALSDALRSPTHAGNASPTRKRCPRMPDSGNTDA